MRRMQDRVEAENMWRHDASVLTLVRSSCNALISVMCRLADNGSRRVLSMFGQPAHTNYKASAFV